MFAASLGAPTRAHKRWWRTGALILTVSIPSIIGLAGALIGLHGGSFIPWFIASMAVTAIEIGFLAIAARRHSQRTEAWKRIRRLNRDNRVHAWHRHTHL